MTQNRNWWAQPIQSDRSHYSYGRTGPIDSEGCGELSWTATICLTLAVLGVGVIGALACWGAWS